MLTQLRNSKTADIDKIAEIHVSCWRECYNSFMPNQVLESRNFSYRQDQWRSWFSHQPDNELLLSVVNEAGEVVGFTIAKPNHDKAIDARGELHAAYVLKAYRGGVTGPQIMLSLIRFLKRAGNWPACVWAWRENPMRRVYTGLGWKPVIERERDIAGVKIPEIGYISPPYEVLVPRLEKMKNHALQRSITAVYGHREDLRRDAS